MSSSILIKKVVNNLKKCSKMSELDIDVKAAADLGKAAFHAGLKRVPALDKKMMKFIKETQDKNTTSFLLKAWLKAWDTENINKKVSNQLIKSAAQLENIEIDLDLVPEKFKNKNIFGKEIESAYIQKLGDTYTLNIVCDVVYTAYASNLRIFSVHPKGKDYIMVSMEYNKKDAEELLKKQEESENS